MARPKKGEEKLKETPKSAQVHVNIEDFVRTRDSVVTGLATLQNAVQDLSRSYIAHTNTVLGRPLGTPLSLPPLDENAILNLAHSSSADASQSKAIKQEKKEKKEKKKRERDPNMPKRPLTAYFLYMKTARPIIAKDLPKATPGQIAEEGTRRWGEMDEEEKKAWRTSYTENLRKYTEEVKKYKEEKGENTEIDDAAAQLAAEGAAAEEIDSEFEKEALDDEDVEETDEEEEKAPPKTPSPPKSPKPTKGRKIAKASSPKRAAGANRPKETPILPPTVQTPVPPPGVESSEAPGTKSPEKRKRTSKAAKAGTETAKEATKDVEEPKSTSKVDSQDGQKKEPRTRKKRKSSAIGS